MDTLQYLAPQIFVAAITAIIASFFTSRFALRRFYSEKWWEKKQEAYSNMLEVLHKLKNYAEQHFDRERTGHEPTDDAKKKLEADWRGFHAEYLKLRDLASFHLSNRAVDILDRYEKQKEAAKSDFFLEWIMADLAAVTDCLEKLKKEARRDLRVK